MIGRRRGLGWLAALPVALVLVAAATGSRLELFWWDAELREATTGTRGEPVWVVDRYETGRDELTRELMLTVRSVESATTVEDYSGKQVPVAPAPGTRVWAVTLGIEADPGMPLTGCQVSILDTRDRESQAASGLTADPYQLPSPSCVPSETPGPAYGAAIDPESEPRPREYDVEVFVVTHEDAVPDRVRVWWEAPDYTEVSVETG
ncbi:MAG: hypothetical protein ACXWDL_04350 [Nocardioides sp.]